jgi:hypothetical protein
MDGFLEKEEITMDINAKLRPARPDDYEFAWLLYAEAVKPYMIANHDHKWNDPDEKRRFSKIWRPEKTSIIILGDKNIGWLAFDETGDEVAVENGYIAPEFQRRGIGSSILGGLLEGWKAKRKSVSLSMLKKSPHRPFFERLGFKESGQKDITISFHRPAV